MDINIENCWNYYLALESDLSKTSQFVEPRGQESVYSFEFYKIIVLACVEAESLFKVFCLYLENIDAGDIAIYKGVLLKHFPQITRAEVQIKRCGLKLKPFLEWSEKPLPWWTEYQEIKHNRGGKFEKATYFNAVSALSALYLLILYYSRLTGVTIHDQKSEYIVSEYSKAYLVISPSEKLPGF